MRKLIAATTLAAILLLSWTISQPPQASADAKEPLYMALIDRHATSASQESHDLAASFVGLLSTLREGQRIGFLTAGDESPVGPSVSGSVEHRSDYKEALARLAAAGETSAPDLAGALAHAHEVMKFQGADVGSTLYLVSGGATGDAPESSAALESAIREFNMEGWRIVSVALPGSSGYADEALDAVASGTGSERYPLGSPNDLKVIADSILSQDARGTLFEIGNDELASGDVFTASLNIAPSTTAASLVFFKEGPTGSLSLRNPAGVEATESDRALSSVIETPHMVVWTLVDPAPGKWTVDVRGREGFISAWHYPKHTLSMDFVSFDSVPYDQRVDLVAFISDGASRVASTDVEVRAIVTDAAGETRAYMLNDRGELGDAVSGDTYYSTTLPPLGAEGEYEVELELYWPQYDHAISRRKVITAQAFPSLAVDLTATEGLTPGERANIGSAVVNVKGQPYAIPIGQISADVSSASGGTVELTPQSLLNTGHAWAFDIMFTPAGEELHTLALRLDMEYASRSYSFIIKPVVLSSFPLPEPTPVVAPPAPVAPAVAPAPVAPDPVVVAPVVAETLPTPESAGGVPAWALYALGALAVGLVAAGGGYVAYALSKPKPYGYLYGEQGDLLADMSALKRGLWAEMTSRNLVRGEELGAAELRGLSLYFDQGQVDIRSAQTEPSIRINNKPLIAGEQTRASNQSWIGTQGKLFSLRLGSPLPSDEPFQAPLEFSGDEELSAAPSVGDD